MRFDESGPAPVPRVAFDPVPHRVRLERGAAVLADTEQALLMLEADHRPSYYLPLEDVAPGVLQPSDRMTFCSRKGTAHYWHLVVGGEVVEDAGWTYPERCAGVDLGGYVSFFRHAADRWLVDASA